MIISCEKCNKKFEISDDLIPSKGRILQCGSCMHKWHFVPIDEDQPVLKIKESNDTDEDSKEQTIQKKDTFKQTDVKKDKKVGFLSYLLVFIISFIALIIIAETFKPIARRFLLISADLTMCSTPNSPRILAWLRLAMAVTIPQS